MTHLRPNFSIAPIKLKRTASDFLRGAMKQFQILAYALLCLAIGLAQASSAEWKLYGGASDKGGHVICFFDADGVVKTADVTSSFGRNVFCIASLSTSTSRMNMMAKF